MPPIGQYVFAEIPQKTGHFTAGRQEWLPYSIFSFCFSFSYLGIESDTITLGAYRTFFMTRIKSLFPLKIAMT